MISNIKIKNFQRHVKWDLELSPTINLIVGSGDTGKSSVIRALRWCLFNSVVGTKHIRRGSKAAQVLVEVKKSYRPASTHVNDVQITRTRSASVNKYVLNGEELRAFGLNEVPEVVEQHGLQEQLCFQSQHDGAFLLSWGTKATKFLNKLIDMDLMARVLREMNVRLLRVGRELKAVQEKEIDLAKDISLLDFVSPATQMVDALLQQEIEIRKRQSTHDTVTTKCIQVEENICVVRKLQWVNHAVFKWESLQQLRLDFGAQCTQHEALRRHCQIVIEATNTCSALSWSNDAATKLMVLQKNETEVALLRETLFKRRESITRHQALGDTKKTLQTAAEKAERLLTRSLVVGKIRDRVGHLSDLLLTVEEQSEYVDECMDEVAKEIKNGKEIFGDRCPLCGAAGFSPDSCCS